MEDATPAEQWGDRQQQLLTLDLARYLHERQHRSKKIYVCASDMELAAAVVARVRAALDEDHRHS